MNTPKVSIIVSVQNMAAYLDECVQSILNQTYSDFELILINDGSNDESGSMCEGYARQDGRVRVMHNDQKKGISAVRNQGVSEARGEYLMQIDADDYVAPDLVEKLLNLCLEQGTKLSACNHWIVRRGKGKPCFPMEGGVRVFSARECCENVLYHGVPDVSVWGKLIHRSVAKQLTYPEGKVYEDTYRIAELLLAAGRMAYTPEPLYSYRIRHNSISRGKLDDSKWQYIDAVRHMNQVMLAAYPDLQMGALRRETHALLSVRRYFIGCKKEQKPKRRELEKAALKNAGQVLEDPRLPMRDKLALYALKIGPLMYDALFTAYACLRG